MRDVTSFRMHELADVPGSNYRLGRRIPGFELAQKLKEELRFPTMGRDAATLLQRHLQRIESRMAVILSRRSRYYWLHLASRIPPESPEGASEWSTALARRVLRLAILKHGADDPTGSRNEEEFTQNDEGFIVPRLLTYEDVLSVGQAEYLSFAYDSVTSSLRRIWKGGILLPTDDAHGYEVQNTHEQERLIEHIDRRKRAYTSFLSAFGSVADIDGRRNPEDGLGNLIVPVLNIDRYEWHHNLSGNPVTTDPQFPFRPNYLLLPFYVDEVSEILSLFDAEIVQRFGIARDELIAFLWVLDIRELMLMLEDPRRQYTMMQRGYMTIRNDKLTAVVRDLSAGFRGVMEVKFQRRMTAGEALDATRRVMRFLTYTVDQLRGISLWDASPARVFIPVFRNMLICDYSQIPSVLSDMFAELSSLSGASGNIKGDNFEHEVHRAVNATPGLGGWEFGKKLRTKEGTCRNVDVSFILGSTLWLIECKAMGEPYRLARGEEQSLRARWKTLDGYCRQAKSLAELIAQNPVGRNYTVPAGVTAFEWAVCTPGAEYIPTLADEYWIAEDIPRVCTPRELLDRLRR